MYGNLATIIMVMVWLYICMNLLLYGAEINAYFEKEFRIAHKSVQELLAHEKEKKQQLFPNHALCQSMLIRLHVIPSHIPHVCCFLLPIAHLCTKVKSRTKTKSVTAVRAPRKHTAFRGAYGTIQDFRTSLIIRKITGLQTTLAASSSKKLTPTSTTKM